mmetsp:Transcript_19938/g.64729  ORF Transcript_19938/g.64729 Transcript_19938/m.64729 type:complete len:269 (-) Transcript_19938:931-1737(-)
MRPPAHLWSQLQLQFLANHHLAIPHPHRLELSPAQLKRRVVRRARKVYVEALPGRVALGHAPRFVCDAPLARTPRSLQRPRRQKGEGLDAGPGPVCAQHACGQRRGRDLGGSRALPPPADSPHRVAGWPRVPRRLYGLHPCTVQPGGGRVGAGRGGIELPRRVGAAVVPLVHRPFPDCVVALRPARQRVLDPVRVMEDVVVGVKIVVGAGVGVGLDLEGRDLVPDAEAGGGDGVGPHLQHPILDEHGRLGPAPQDEGAIEPRLGHLSQ